MIANRDVDGSNGTNRIETTSSCCRKMEPLPSIESMNQHVEGRQSRRRLNLSNLLGSGTFTMQVTFARPIPRVYRTLQSQSPHKVLCVSEGIVSMVLEFN